MKSNQNSIVLYDGQCGFCSHWMKFISKHDKHQTIQLLPLQSHEAVEILRPHGIDATAMDSVVFIAAGTAYTQSSAVVRVLAALNFPWCCLSVAWLVPRFVRDALYRSIAQRRMRNHSCFLK